MGYYTYLQQMLQPLQVYNFSGSVNGAELAALGTILDDCCGTTEQLEAECTVPSASGYGLENYEAIMHQVPVYSDLASRRQAIMALLQIDDASFTKQSLDRTLAGCGIAACVEETGEWYTVQIRFPGTRGVPERIEVLQTAIEEILPCHLDVVYVYEYVTWAELESMGLTWEMQESAKMDWDTIERLMPTEQS